MPNAKVQMTNQVQTPNSKILILNFDISLAFGL
jgi:hypothetical protein